MLPLRSRRRSLDKGGRKKGYLCGFVQAYTNAVLADGSYVVIYVKEAKKHEAKPEDLAGITRELSSVYGESDRRGYLDALEHSLGVEVQRPDFVKGEAKQTEE